MGGFLATPAEVNVVTVSGSQYPSQNSSTPLDVGGEDARVDGQNNETTGQSYTIPAISKKKLLGRDGRAGKTWAGTSETL